MPDQRDDYLTQLFASSYASLRRYVQRLVRSRETAEEIVQEAFLRTHQHGREEQAPKAFLYSIARNLATDHHRRNRRIGEASDEDVSLQEPSTESTVLSEERSRLLRAAIARLPPQRRLVFTLKVFHDKSYKEIAEQLGITVKTVENHISQALRDTHDYLQRRYE